MPNNNFATVLAGFTNTNFYQGPAGFMPGGGTFVASALFSVLDTLGADQYIVTNRDVATFRGWALLARPDAGFVELFAQVGDGLSMNETSLGSYSLGALTLVHISATPGAVSVYIQGTLIATIAVTGVASPNALIVGAREGGADPASGVQLVGLAYGSSVPWSGPLSVFHMQNCQAAAYDMARIIQAPAGTPGADFIARFSARQGAVQPGVVPTVGALTWAPSAGATALTRQGGGQSPATVPLVNPSWAISLG